MLRDQAKEHIKNKLLSYLKEKGIDPSKPFKCLSPDHNDKNPSMKYDTERNKVHCFSCSVDYDIFDIIGIQYNLNTFPDQFNKACQIFSIPLNEEFKNEPKTEQKQAITLKVEKDQKEYINKSHSLIGETDYPQQRGLSQATINLFKLGYDPYFNTKGSNGEYTTWHALIIPTSNSSFTARNIDLKADKNDRIRKTGSSPLFNLEALEGNKPVFIVEGEIDAMSILEVGGQAIGLGSTANYQSLISHLKENIPKIPILLALDNDEAGRDTTDKLQKGFLDLRIPFFDVDILGDYKDPNEALRKDLVSFRSRVMEESRKANLTEEERYSKTSAGANIISFINGIHANADTPSISTGFNKIDDVLDGGLYEGLYIVGAISSLGKTTLITQMADQIAQKGQDILLFSLEMAKTEIMAKSISRHSLINARDDKNISYAKATRGITEGRRWKDYSTPEVHALNKAAMDYGEYAIRIFIHEGIGDIGVDQIRKKVEMHKRITGNTPVIIIDYLQILAPYNERATDKQNTDKAVMELKRISRDYKTPVIGISSFNRQSYNNSATMEAFKESGAVEYSSDVLIGLQLEGVGRSNFNVDEAKRKEPREIELKILKNRNGRSGDIIKYNYYPAYNFFEEV